MDHDIKIMKGVILFFWVGLSMTIFFILNLAANKSLIAFVAVIFGCNVVYDIAKKIIGSTISSKDGWYLILKRSVFGVLFFVFSFVGIYVEIRGLTVTYLGVGLIWLPSYIISLLLLSKSEELFKELEAQQSNVN